MKYAHANFDFRLVGLYQKNNEIIQEETFVNGENVQCNKLTLNIAVNVLNDGSSMKYYLLNCAIIFFVFTFCKYFPKTLTVWCSWTRTTSGKWNSWIRWKMCVFTWRLWFLVPLFIVFFVISWKLNKKIMNN